MTFDAQSCARARAEFPALARRLDDGQPIAYLDGPAGSQVPTAVIDAIAGYYRTSNANSHGAFATSEHSDAMVESVREKCAALLGAAGPHTISFGANMTTLNFALARAVGRSLQAGDEVVITALDHEGNRGPWLSLVERGVVIREAAVRADGTLDADDLANQIRPRTRLVAMGLASNALGTVNDVALARRLSREVGAWLVLDAVHHAPHFAIDVTATGADFLLCSAYKLYGPHVGILYSRPGLLDQLATDRLRTAPQEAPGRIETGTMNFAAVAGVGAAIDWIAGWGDPAAGDLRARLLDAFAGIGAWERALAERYVAGLSTIPGVTVHGPPFVPAVQRAPTVSIAFADHDPTTVARRLGDRGIQVWDGHFYALRAVEVLGLAARGGLLRTGFLLYNTPDEVDRLLAALREDLAA